MNSGIYIKSGREIDPEIGNGRIVSVPAVNRQKARDKKKENEKYRSTFVARN